MVGEIAGVISSLKAIKDISETMIGLRDAAAFQEKRLELQSKLLDAQAAAFAANDERAALIERVSSLEQEVARLKAWEAEKQRYELKALSEGGPLAYAIKPDAQGSEPPHHVCASCYQRAEKSILQPETRVPGRDEVLVCRKCGSDLYVNGMPRPEHFRGRRSR